MKKTILIPLFTIVSISVLIIFFINRADEYGKIVEIEKNQFLLSPIKIDPEAEYDFSVIHFSNETKVVGNSDSILDLKEGQKVKLWTEETGLKGIKVAKKIKVVET